MQLVEDSRSIEGERNSWVTAGLSVLECQTFCHSLSMSSLGTRLTRMLDKTIL